jgi:hypothetical protein
MSNEYENEVKEAKRNYISFRQKIFNMYKNIPEEWKKETVNVLTATECGLLEKGVLPKERIFWDEKMAILTKRLNELINESQSQII